jgi:mitogen-activated protein kinase 1/3
MSRSNSRASSKATSPAGSFQETQVGYNKFYIDSRYVQLRPAGDGAYGFVASAIDSVTGHKVAIKKIKDAFIDLIDAKRILRELKLLKHLNSHENIVSILDIMTVPPYTHNFEDIYIVTNLMESDLERIVKSKQRLTDQHFQYFLYQILRALKYVHSANVLHRDLKPSNLLVNANCDLALCDFGLARGFETEGEDTLTQYVVTRWYRAPELLCESPYYGKPVDIWSVGCIFSELLAQEPFFRGENPQHQLEVIVSKIGCPSRKRLDFIENTSALHSILQYAQKTPPDFQSLFPRDSNPLAIDLIKRMLTFHPDDRITVEDALNHPYLKDFNGQLGEPLCPNRFDFSFENDDTKISTRAEIQMLMFQEMLTYRPEQSGPSSQFISEAKNERGQHYDGKEYYDSNSMDIDSGHRYSDSK